ncbi:MAG: PAAR domain-containing protein [Pseudomonadota bacterium]
MRDERQSEWDAMIIRYEITLGASTTAGGEVVSANPRYTILGVPVAYADDSVSCPACNTIGVVKPDGPRLSETFNGKQVALSDDLCICKCSPPPRLLANQTFSWQQIDGDWHAEQAGAAAGAAAKLNQAAARAAASDGIPLVLLDPDTEEPYQHRSYRLELKDGVIEGTTDSKGATRPLTAKERALFVRWYVDSGTTSV